MRSEPFTRFAEWFDEYGFIHLQPNPGPEQSENGPMYTALFYLLVEEIYGLTHKDKGKVGELLESLMYQPDSLKAANGQWEYRPTPLTKYPPHLSHDNATGIMCLAEFSNFSKHYQSFIPMFSKNRLHPRDVIFYGWVKSKVWSILGSIPSMAMMISCGQTYKYRDDKKIVKTDGKLLAFLRCRTFKLKYTFEGCTDFIYENPIFGCWRSVAEIYFGKEHPITILMKEWEEKHIEYSYSMGWEAKWNEGCLCH